MYRYVDVCYSVTIDAERELYGTSDPKLVLQTFRIEHLTKCGVWIEYGGKLKFINLSATKQFACTTDALARASYRERKKAEVRIYKARLAKAEKALALVDETAINELELS